MERKQRSPLTHAHLETLIFCDHNKLLIQHKESQRHACELQGKQGLRNAHLWANLQYYIVLKVAPSLTSLCLS